MTHNEALSKLEIEEGATSSEINTQYQEFYNEFQMRITNAPTEHQRKLYKKKLEELSEAFKVLGGENAESNTQELPGISESENVETEKHVKLKVSSQLTMSKEKALQILGMGEKFTSKELENAFQTKVSTCETGRDNAINDSILNAYEEAIIECNSAYNLLKDYIFIAPPIVKDVRPSIQTSKDNSATKKKWGLPVSIVSGVIIVVIIFFAFVNGSSNTDEHIDPATHDKYVSLKSQADLLAKQGNWAEALSKYEKAFSLVETPDVKDSIASMGNQLRLTSNKIKTVVDQQKEASNNGKKKEFEEKSNTTNKQPKIEYSSLYSEPYINGLRKVHTEDYNYGYVNKAGEIVIPFKYNEAYAFDNGLAYVCINNKCGFINTKGEVVVPLVYDFDNFFSRGMEFHEDLARVKLNEKWGFVNKNGKVVIPLMYTWAYDYEDGLAKVDLGNYKYIHIDKKGNCIKDCP